MRIKGHVNSSADLYTAWPDTITELHVSVQDESQTNLLERFDEVSTFIGRGEGGADIVIAGNI